MEKNEKLYAKNFDKTGEKIFVKIDKPAQICKCGSLQYKS
jgi:CDGSH-type Zn-finger protein